MLTRRRTSRATARSAASLYQAQSAEAVREAILEARRSKCRLSVVSSSHRAGCIQATTDATRILDLSAMNRIRAIDPRDKVAIVEAGVTFAAATQALAAQGLRPHTPLCPVGSSSVVASYLDREPILSVREQWDVTDPFGSAEMVLGTGEIWASGNAFPASFADQWEAGHRFLNSLGPAGVDFLRVVQGSQGGLGVVTWAAVLCQPIPAASKACVVTADTLEPLLAIATALTRRRMGDAIVLGNGLLFATMLSATNAEAVVKAAALPKWILLVDIIGNDPFPADVVGYEVLELARSAQAHGLEVAATLGGRSADEVAKVMRAPAATDFRDRIGEARERLYFLSQLTSAADLCRLAEPWPRSPAIYVQPRLQGRNCHVEFVLPTGTPGTTDDDVRALARTCAAAGGYFSRPAPLWEDVSRRSNPSILPYLRQTKALLDPDGVLASRSGWPTWGSNGSPVDE